MEPFLCVGGIELANGPRARAYVRGAYGGRVRLPADCLDCWAYAPGPYTSPGDDPAPWWTAGRPESAEFLGVIPSKITLDPVVNRPVTDRTSGDGGDAGPQRLRPRIVAVEATLYGATKRGLAYGRSWVADVLHDECAHPDGGPLLVWTACPDVDDPDPDRWERLLTGAVLVDGPTFDPVGVSGLHAAVMRWQWSAKMPWLLGQPQTIIGQDDDNSVVLYGRVGTMGDMEGRTTTPSGHPLSVVPVAGWWGLAGLTLSGVSPGIGNRLILGAKPLSGDDQVSTMTRMALGVLHLDDGTYYELIVPSSSGLLETANASGLGGGSTSQAVPVTTTRGARAVVTSGQSYHGWEIGGSSAQVVPSGRIAVIGASITKDMADYAGRVAGSKFDEKYDAIALNGGDLDGWVFEADMRWERTEAYEATRDYPTAVLWQLANRPDHLNETQATLEGWCDTVWAAIVAHWPDVPVYVVAHPPYEPGSNCATTPAVSDLSADLVAYVVATKGPQAVAGPVLPQVPVSHVQETSCHLTPEGRTAQATILNDFFGLASATGQGVYPAVLALRESGGRLVYDVNDVATVTTGELRNSAGSVEGRYAYPAATNSFGETYYWNRGLVAEAVLPQSGLIVRVHAMPTASDTTYPPDPAATDRSGRVELFDPETGRLLDFYQLPDMTYQAASLLVRPFQVVVDPSSALGDERFLVLYQATNLSAAARPWAAQEWKVNASQIDAVRAGTVAASAITTAPASVPFVGATSNSYVAAAFDLDGTAYLASATVAAVPVDGVAVTVFPKVNGERAYVTGLPFASHADAFAQYGAIASGLADPTWRLPQLSSTGAATVTLHPDPSGTIVVVGRDGTVRAAVADRPLVRRAQLAPNPGPAFTTVDGWEAAEATSVISLVDGRIRVTRNTNNGQGNLRTTSTGHATLTADDEGHDFKATAVVRWPNGTPRTHSAGIEFLDASNVSLGVATFGPTTAGAADDRPATHAVTVPVGARRARLLVRGNSLPTGDFYDVTSVEGEVAPFSPSAVLDLGRDELVNGQPSAASFKMVGGCVVDGRVFVGVQGLRGGTAVNAKAPGQYVYSVPVAALTGGTAAWAATMGTPEWVGDATCVVEVRAGEPDPVTNLRVKVTPQRSPGDPCPSPWPATWEVLIPRMNPGDVLRIDGTTREVTVTRGATHATEPGYDLLVPVEPALFDSWPDVPACTTACVTVEVEGTANPNTAATVDVYDRTLA